MCGAHKVVVFCETIMFSFIEPINVLWKKPRWYLEIKIALITHAQPQNMSAVKPVVFIY